MALGTTAEIKVKYRNKFWIFKAGRMFLTAVKFPPQFDFCASVISNSFYENTNLPSIHCNMLAHLCNFYMLFFCEINRPNELMFCLLN